MSMDRPATKGHAHVTELLDHEITGSLQQLEDNVCEATDVALSLLSHLKRGNVALKRAATTMAVWHLRFQHATNTTGVLLHTSHTSRKRTRHHFTSNTPPALISPVSCVLTPLRAAQDHNYSCARDEFEGTSSCTTSNSTTTGTSISNSVPRTPSMPTFRSHLARTPALLLTQRRSRSDTPDSSNVEHSFSTRLYMPSKTPGPSRGSRTGESRSRRRSSSTPMPHDDDLNDLECEYGCNSPYISSPLMHEALTMQFSATSTKASRKLQQRRLGTADSDDNINNNKIEDGVTQRHQEQQHKQQENDTSDKNNRTPMTAAAPATAAAAAAVATPEKREGANNRTLRTPSLRSPLVVSSLNSTCNHEDVDAPGDDNDNNAECGSVYSKGSCCKGRTGTPLSERITVLTGQLPASRVKHTPISLRCASRARAAVVQERAASVLVESQEEESPDFQLSLFPRCFQKGQGSLQITALYACFQTDFGESRLGVVDLSKCLPEFDLERIELLLEMLVSRRLLIPVVDRDNELRWQLPANKQNVEDAC